MNLNHELSQKLIEDIIEQKENHGILDQKFKVKEVLASFEAKRTEFQDKYKDMQTIFDEIRQCIKPESFFGEDDCETLENTSKDLINIYMTLKD